MNVCFDNSSFEMVVCFVSFNWMKCRTFKKLQRNIFTCHVWLVAYIVNWFFTNSIHNSNQSWIQMHEWTIIMRAIDFNVNGVFDWLLYKIVTISYAGLDLLMSKKLFFLIRNDILVIFSMQVYCAVFKIGIKNIWKNKR